MAVTSVAMETTVEFSHVSSTNWTIFAPFNDKVVMFNCLSFHPPYTKGLKVSYERVRPQESKYGGCVDGRHQRCHGNDG